MLHALILSPTPKALINPATQNQNPILEKVQKTSTTCVHVSCDTMNGQMVFLKKYIENKYNIPLKPYGFMVFNKNNISSVNNSIPYKSMKHAGMLESDGIGSRTVLAEGV